MGTLSWLRDLQRGALRRTRRSKTHIRYYTHSTLDQTLPLNKIMPNNENVFLGVSDIGDLVSSELLAKRYSVSKSTIHRHTEVLCNCKQWILWMEETFGDKLFVQTSASSGFVVDTLCDSYFKYSASNNQCQVSVYGDKDWVAQIITQIEAKFSVVTSKIEWVYNSDGSSCSVPLNCSVLPIDEMYPFLNGEKLTDYYNRFMNSSANILLLLGKPGTGKTTFIRGLLAHSNSSALVSYDAEILQKDGFFARFIEGEDDLMVLEDSDAFLKSRSDGNLMMHRFLNVGDGLVTTKGKKMIFSTNLPSIRDVDTALTRPGRCFDTMTFRELTHPEALNLAAKMGVEIVGAPKEKYSLADIFNKQTFKPVSRSMGFV
jgi:hypothetical protein